MVGLLLIAGCMADRVLVEGSCDPRALGAGEVRARRIPCGDELIAGGDGRTGEFLVENSRQRFVVREPGRALTRLGVAGGTLLDAAVPGGTDALVEIVPSIGGEWFVEVEVEPWIEEGRAGLDLRGVLPGGGEAEARYALEADGDALLLEGVDAIDMVPAAGAAVVGGSVEGRGGASSEDEPRVGADGDLVDLGGWVRWEGATRVAVGTRDDVLRALDPGAVPVSGVTEQVEAGEPRVEAVAGDEVVAWVAVEGGAFSGWVPGVATGLRLAAEGYAPGPEHEPGEDLVLEAGGRGVIHLRVADEAGRDLPAIATWGDESWVLPEGGGLVPVGPGSGRLRVAAGPVHEVFESEEIEVAGEVEVGAVLRSTGAAPLLARIGVEAWPDADVRESAAAVLARAAAEGVGFAALVADDEVAVAPDEEDVFAGEAPDAHVRDALRFRAGSRARSTRGQPFAWSWSGNARKAAHGAAPWEDLDPLDLVALMDRGGSRLVVADPDWVAAAGAPIGWDPVPFALRIDSLDDLPVYFSLLDDWVPITLLGPTTWVGDPGDLVPNAVDVERLLVEGRTVASNGPRISLSAGGAGPGDLVEAEGAVGVEVGIDAPDWMPVRGAALYGPGGAVLASWEVSASERRLLAKIPAVAWVVAACWGDEATWTGEVPWAATGAAWLGRGEATLPPHRGAAASGAR